MHLVRTRVAVGGLLALIVAASVAIALSGNENHVSVVAVSQDAGTTAPPVPGEPVTMEGVAARLDCPDPPDPNGPGEIASVTGDPAPGLGEATPDAALSVFLNHAWPNADAQSFVVTARNSAAVRFENRHAALLATFVEGGVWNVNHATYCGTMAAEWQAPKR